MKKILLTAALFALVMMACNKEEEPVAPVYYFETELNGLSFTDPDSYGVMEYMHEKEYHHMHIKTQLGDTLADGTRNRIVISISYPPKTGKYYFNNDGPDQAVYGAIGMVHGWAHNMIDEPFITHSIDGFVDITSLTKTTITGSFEFTATPTQTSSSLIDTIHVENGNFHVLIKLVSGMSWEGPEP